MHMVDGELEVGDESVGLGLVSGRDGGDEGAGHVALKVFHNEGVVEFGVGEVGLGAKVVDLEEERVRGDSVAHLETEKGGTGVLGLARVLELVVEGLEELSPGESAGRDGGKVTVGVVPGKRIGVAFCEERESSENLLLVGRDVGDVQFNGTTEAMVRGAVPVVLVGLGHVDTRVALGRVWGV